MIMTRRCQFNDIQAYSFSRGFFELPDRCQREEGLTPLCKAAQNGHYTIIEKLLKKGAEVDHAGKDGRTALWLASRLERCPPDAEGSDSIRYTPEDIVELLVKYGANVNARSSKGHTPLIGATVAGRLAVVDHLLKRGADLKLADSYDQSPLMHAAGHVLAPT